MAERLIADSGLVGRAVAAPAAPTVARPAAPRRRRGVSLRYKLFLALLLTTLLSYSAASWAVYDRIEAGSRAQMLAQARATGKLAEALYEQRGATLETAAKTVALSNDVILAAFVTMTSPKEQGKLVEALVPLEHQLNVTSITITNMDGDVVVRSSEPPNWGDNISNRFAGVRAALAGTPNWGAEVEETSGLVLRGSHPMLLGLHQIG